MTFPSGAPGGFPGQGPQQPQQQYPGVTAPASGGPGMGLTQILYLVTAGFGVLNLFLGFANLAGGGSFYENGAGWVSGLLFIGGLVAAFTLLPGDHKPGPWPAVFGLGVMLPFLFTIFQIDASLQVGGILILVFGIVQAAAAVAAYLFDAGILKSPTPAAAPYGGQPGAYGHQPGAFGSQQFGQQPFGQQAGEGTGGMAQPTKIAQPVNQPSTQQPTQYAPQQGQFFHQPSGEGQQQNNPGTPPGGTGQPTS